MFACHSGVAVCVCLGAGEVLKLCLKVLQRQGEESWNLAWTEHPKEPCVN